MKLQVRKKDTHRIVKETVAVILGGKHKRVQTIAGGKARPQELHAKQVGVPRTHADEAAEESSHM